jgi:putative phosphoribosyl transferase
MCVIGRKSIDRSRYPVCIDFRYGIVTVEAIPFRSRPMNPRDFASIRFTDRHQAGAELARKLVQYRDKNAVVLALPRGGVPVGYEVARQLDADLDVFVVRKLGMPGHREYAIGAIASGGVQFLDHDVLRLYGVPATAVEAVAREELAELERREREYRQNASLIPLQRRIAILVDDGLATGSTMKAAVEAVRRHEPARVVVAVPVGAPSTCRELAALADEVVCARTPEPFSAVGLWYDDFSQTTDAEVRDLLRRASHREAASTRS